MRKRHTRTLVRVLVGTALCTALSASIAVPVPGDLPAIAIRQPGLYRLEVALLVFYGWLLLLTPAFSGLIRGRLPTEISTRGAKFEVDADRSTELNALAIEGLKREVSALSEEVSDVEVEIERLKKGQVTARD
jgi:hypothetical protein